MTTKPRRLARVGLWFVVPALLLAQLLAVRPLLAAPTVQPRLSIVELNITGDEFVTIQNTGTTAVTLSNYWLGYTNDIASLPTPVQQLPDVSLSPGTVLLLSSDTEASCGASYAGSLGPSLSNAGGKLALWQLTTLTGGPPSLAMESGMVSWGDASASPSYLNMDADKSVKTYLADNPTILATASPVWYLTALDPAQPPSWQHGYLQGCAYTALLTDEDTTSPTNQTISWPAAASGPPFISVGSVVLGAHTETSQPHIPTADHGLKAVQLSELLPNTASPQTDADDEFIELYNPNQQNFDLSGFILQTASASSSATHTYHFPVGTTIAGGSFKAFRSSQTHLSLSNSGGQVWLVDPLGTTVDSSDPYGKADDGLAWVNAGGHWQWTARPTPGSTNKVATPITATSSSRQTATVNNKKVTAVASSAGGSVQGAATTNSPQVAPVASIHPLTLALVIAAALLYGAYEYRYDLANHYRQFRRHRNLRR